MLRATILCLSLAATAMAAPGSQPMPIDQHAEALTVFAAASLSDVMKELVQGYQANTGRVVRLSLASSSTLARQIENGARADLFLSADEEWMAYLDQRRLIATDTWTRPIGNRLVMIAPADRAEPLTLSAGFDLAGRLDGGRLAIADPAHVPAGRYARQALEHLGLWHIAEAHLARADNVRAALALVERGEAPLGIVYATDARTAKSARVVAEFPAGSHRPIRYSFAAVAGRDGVATRELLVFLTDESARALYAAHGFTTP